MKKSLSLFLVLTVCMSLCILPSSAKEMDENVGVIVNYNEDYSALDAPTVGNIDDEPYCQYAVAKAKTVHDLSDGSLSFDWTLRAESSKTSSELLKTNTTKITVVVATDDRVSLTIELLNSNGVSLNETTITPGNYEIGRPTSVTFTNLTASKNYSIKMTNNSQVSVQATGVFKD